MFPFTVETKRFFILILAAKILILGVFFVTFGEDRLLWADAPTYLDLGRNAITGNGFSQTALDGSVIPNTRFMPLYPTLIGFFSVYVPHGMVFVSLLQAAAAAGIAVFAYKIGLFFLPNRWAGGAALITTFEPLISVIHILIMPETLFVLFLTGFVYYFLEYLTSEKSGAEVATSLRPRYGGGSNLAKNASVTGLPRSRHHVGGLAMTMLFLILAAYTKPAALYLIVFPVLFLIFARKEYVRAGVFAGIFILALASWMARNASVGGNFAVTNDDTGNICGWTLHGVIATKYGVDPTDWSTTWDKPEFLEGQEQCTGQIAALKLFLSEYPAPFFKTMVLSSASLLTNDGYSVFFEKPAESQVKPHHNFLTPAVFSMSDWKEKLPAALSEFSSSELAIIFAGKLFWMLVLVFAVIGTMALLKNPQYRIPVLFIFLIILYFISATVFVTAYGAGARLRYPIAGFLIFLAAGGIEWFYNTIWRRHTNTESNTIPNAGL